MSECQCYKSKKELDRKCEHKALNGSKYCGVHKSCTILFGKQLQHPRTEQPPSPSSSKPPDHRKKTAQRFLSESQKPSSLRTVTKVPIQLTKLSGPNQFYYFNLKKLGKKIVLMGEMHSILGICKNVPVDYVEVHDWIESLVLESPECIDLFIEVEQGVYRNKDYGYRLKLNNYPSGLIALRERFAKCHESAVYVKDPVCYDGKLRVHWTDLRHIRKPIIADSPFNEIYLRTYRIPEPIREYNDDEYMSFLRYQIGLENGAQIRERYTKYYRTFAGLSGIVLREDYQMYEEQRDISVAFINKELNKLDPRIDRKNFLETLCNVERDVAFPLIPYKTYGGLLILPMDAYFLLRIFTSFDKSKMARGPRYCQDDFDSSPRNIIAYVGGAHSLIYVEFIKRFFGTPPEISVDLTSDVKTRELSCITLPKPFNFFE
jgi:hypothetical protein